MELINKQRRWFIEKYVSYFFIYSFIGWVIEVILFLFETKEFVNRGFLNMPILPIYGFGAVLISLIYKDDDHHWFMIALVGGLVASVIELITSYLLELIFNTRLWDYSTIKFNFQGRISLLSTLLFMLGAVLIVKIINPVVERKLRRFKYNIKLELVLIVLTIITFIDCVTSIIDRL